MTFFMTQSVDTVKISNIYDADAFLALGYRIVASQLA